MWVVRNWCFGFVCHPKQLVLPRSLCHSWFVDVPTYPCAPPGLPSDSALMPAGHHLYKILALLTTHVGPRLNWGSFYITAILVMKIIVLTRIYTVKYILLAMSGEGQPVWLYNTSSRTLGHVTSVFVNIYAFPLRRILYWSITVSPEVTLTSSRKEFCSRPISQNPLQTKLKLFTSLSIVKGKYGVF